jgi:hypothetical protein
MEREGPMCLKRIDSGAERDQTREEDGWKVYVLGFETGALRPEIHWRHGEIIPVGKWLQSKPVRLPVYLRRRGKARGRWDEGQRSYMAGWHVFPSQGDAVSWIGDLEDRVICKVRGRGVLARGVQNGFPVVVYRELYVYPVKTRCPREEATKCV